MGYVLVLCGTDSLIVKVVGWRPYVAINTDMKQVWSHLAHVSERLWTRVVSMELILLSKVNKIWIWWSQWLLEMDSPLSLQNTCQHDVDQCLLNLALTGFGDSLFTHLTSPRLASPRLIDGAVNVIILEIEFIEYTWILKDSGYQPVNH